MITLQYVAFVSFGTTFIMYVANEGEVVPSLICAAIISAVCTFIAHFVI